MYVHVYVFASTQVRTLLCFLCASFTPDTYFHQAGRAYVLFFFFFCHVDVGEMWEREDGENKCSYKNLREPLIREEN